MRVHGIVVVVELLQIYQSHYLTSNGAQSYPTALRFFWRHSSNLKPERSFCALIWPFHGSHFTLKIGIIRWWSFLGKTIFHRWCKLLPFKNRVIRTHRTVDEKSPKHILLWPPNLTCFGFIICITMTHLQTMCMRILVLQSKNKVIYFCLTNFF